VFERPQDPYTQRLLTALPLAPTVRATGR